MKSIELSTTLSTKTKDQLKDVLLDPTAPGPDIVYFMFRGNPNVTLLVPGKIGDEYSKTYGHYHKHDEPEKYEILFGTGKFILQPREIKDFEKDVLVIDAKQGDTVSIPMGYGHCMVNTGITPLITADTAPPDASTAVNDYETIKDKHGMACYLVEKNGKLEILKNPSYDSK